MQTALVFLTVSIAALYVVREFYNQWKSNKSKCGQCAKQPNR